MGQLSLYFHPSFSSFPHASVVGGGKIRRTLFPYYRTLFFDFFGENEYIFFYFLGRDNGLTHFSAPLEVRSLLLIYTNEDELP
jgi:hypothetical protein